jgi:hypothetical protein
VGSRPRTDDSDEEQDKRDLRTSVDSHAKRRKSIVTSLEHLPQLSFQSTPRSQISESSQIQFGLSERDNVSSTFSVQSAVTDELGRYAALLPSRKKKPDVVLDKMYKVPKCQERRWNFPPAIPTHLLSSVTPAYRQYDAKQKTWVLNPHHDNGRKEKQLLDQLARQQLLLKITNVMSLGVVATQANLLTMNKRWADLPTAIAEAMSAAQKQAEENEEIFDPKIFVSQYLASFNIQQSPNIKAVDDALQEVQINLNDLNKLTFDAFCKSFKGRRELWASSSSLSKAQESWLNSREIPVPSTSVDLDDEWFLVDKEDDASIRDLKESSHARSQQATDKLLGWSKPQNPKQGKPKSKQGQPKQQQTSKPFHPSPSPSAGQSSKGGSQKTAGKGKYFNKRKQNNK